MALKSVDVLVIITHPLSIIFLKCISTIFKGVINMNQFAMYVTVYVIGC